MGINAKTPRGKGAEPKDNGRWLRANGTAGDELADMAVRAPGVSLSALCLRKAVMGGVWHGFKKCVCSLGTQWITFFRFFVP